MLRRSKSLIPSASETGLPFQHDLAMASFLQCSSGEGNWSAFQVRSGSREPLSNK